METKQKKQKRNFRYEKNLVRLKYADKVLRRTDTGEIVSYRKYPYTIKTLQNIFSASRSWVYEHVQSKLPYIYIPLENEAVRAAFFGEAYNDKKRYPGSFTVFFRLEDIATYFSENWEAYRKTVRLNPNDYYTKDAIRTIMQLFEKYNLKKNVFTYMLIPEIKYAMIHYSSNPSLMEKLVTFNPKLNFDKTSLFPDAKSKYPFDFRSNYYDLQSLSSYSYRASGNRDMLKNGAIRFKLKDNPRKVLYYKPPYQSEYLILEDLLVIRTGDLE